MNKNFKNSFNKNIPTSSNKEKQHTKNQNEGTQCMLISFLFAACGKKKIYQHAVLSSIEGANYANNKSSHNEFLKRNFLNYYQHLNFLLQYHYS